MAKTITIDDNGNIVGYEPIRKWAKRSGISVNTAYVYAERNRIPALKIKLENSFAVFIPEDYIYTPGKRGVKRKLKEEA